MSKSICIMRLSAIGDVCHAAAMVTRITQAWPDSRVTWVIGKIEYQLVKGMANVEFIVCNKSQKNARKQLKQDLAGREFDVLLLMQVALRANWFASVIKATRRIGFDRARSKEGHSLFINERIAATAHTHVLDGFMQFADQLGVPATELEWAIPVDEEDRKWAEHQAKQFGRFVIIAPAASKAMRNWTADGYAQLIQQLQHADITPVLCGGPGPVDAAITQSIMAVIGTNGAASKPHVVHNLVGQTTLKQMLGLMAHAQCVVAPDTGPAHMATTQRTPVVGLYAHSNPLRTGPYLSLQHTVSVYEQAIEQETGKTWQALPWGVRAKGDSWMQTITSEQVWQQVQGFINR